MSAERIDVLAGSEAATYLNELAAEIVANGNPHGDMLVEAMAAHERRQKFAMELAAGSTRRAKMARRVACAGVFAAANVRAELESIEKGEDEATCKQSLQVARAALARCGGA